jgi:hypothetical protein
VIQAILILVAPALYAASIYMILGRLIAAIHAEELSIIPLRWMTKIFVIGDVFSFLLQAGGGGIQSAGTMKMYELGEKIIIVGLFVQIAMFSFFLGTAVTFHRRKVAYDRLSGGSSGQSEGETGATTTSPPIPWRRHLMVLYVVSAVILVRSIFRVVEYLQGNKGFLISHEIFLYIFDALLMAATMAIFFVWYVDDLDTSSPNSKGKRGRRRLLSRDSDGFELGRSANGV